MKWIKNNKVLMGVLVLTVLLVIGIAALTRYLFFTRPLEQHVQILAFGYVDFCETCSLLPEQFRNNIDSMSDSDADLLKQNIRGTISTYIINGSSLEAREWDLRTRAIDNQRAKVYLLKSVEQLSKQVTAVSVSDNKVIITVRSVIRILEENYYKTLDQKEWNTPKDYTKDFTFEFISTPEGWKIQTLLIL